MRGGSTVLGVLGLVAASLVATAPALPAAAAASTAPYVALGDSFTAGPFIPNQLNDPPGCLRSDHDYPHLVAAALAVGLRDASCSGARTDHVFAAQPVHGGLNPPQIDAVGSSTRLVTVQLGGNDIGFAEIVTACVGVLPLGSPCRDRYTNTAFGPRRPGGTDEISRRIAATAPKLSAVLGAVRQRAPAARIFVVAYPAILPEVGPGCWPWLPIAFDDVPFLRDKQKELNAMLAAQAAAAGATYVDAYGPSVGRDACQLPGVRWVEPLVPLTLAAPVHPNAVGMEGVAAVVRAAVAEV